MNSESPEDTQVPDMGHLATKLCAKVELEGGVLFNSKGDSYVRLLNKDHFEIWPVRSRRFKAWLANQSYQENARVPGSETIESAVRLAEAIAFNGGPEIELHNRVAWENGNIYFDIADSKNHVVEITPKGWQVLDSFKAPILFRRYKHQRAAVMPREVSAQAESLRQRLERFFDLVNYDPDTEILHLVQLVFAFVPGLPHPIPNLHGEQGSTKTSHFKVCKALIDPSKMGTLAIPRKEIELVQKLDHHWFAPFDNVTKLWEWQSNCFCRAQGGEGLSKRQLYSDDEDHIYSYKRVIGLNGINVVAEKPDLLDRSILHHLPPIPNRNRLTEKELWDRFDQLAPGLMAAIFDTLSAAMRILPTVKTTGLYRLADFTRWGIAISRALGISAQEFLDEYHNNMNIQNQEALESNPVGAVMLRYLEGYLKDFSELRMTPTEFYNELVGRATDYAIKTDGADWPANVQVMGRTLNVLRTNLAKEGIAFESVHKGKSRYWVFRRREVSDFSVECVDALQSTLEEAAADSSDNGITDTTHLSENKGQSEEPQTDGEEIGGVTYPSNEDESKEIPKTPQQWAKAVLGLFDPDLAANGQHWSLEDIRGEWPSEVYRELDEALYSLLQSGRLEEVSLGLYRRVA